MSVRSSRAVSAARPSAWPATIWPPSSSPTLSARSRLIRRAPLPVADRGDAQRLGGGIDREPGAVAVPAARDDGEAHPAAGDRGADGDGVGIVAAGDLEPREPLRARLDRNHLADVGDDAGEHVRPARMSRPYPAPIASLPMALNPRRSSQGGKRQPVEGVDRHPARCVDGERNSAASSTRSARTKAAARIGPASTMSRVMPRPARQLQHRRKIEPAVRRRPRAAPPTPCACSACSRSRGAASPVTTQSGVCARARHQLARERQPQLAIEHHAHRRAVAHARQPAGQQRVVGQHGADAGEHRIARRAHEMHPRARRLAGDRRRPAAGEAGLAVGRDRELERSRAGGRPARAGCGRHAPAAPRSAPMPTSTTMPGSAMRQWPAPATSGLGSTMRGDHARDARRR